MKHNFIIIVFCFIGYAAFSQSSSQVGISVTPYFQGTNGNGLITFDSRGMKLGLHYQYNFTASHGLIGGVLYQKRITDMSEILTDENGNLFEGQVNYNWNEFIFNTYYIYQYKQWFSVAGFNHVFYEMNGNLTIGGEQQNPSPSGLNSYVLDFHFGLGRDFSLNDQLTLRGSLFLDKSILNTNYLYYGLDLGLFYQL